MSADQLDLSKTPAQLVDRYLHLRNKKEAAEAALKVWYQENFTNEMDRLESQLMEILLKTGMNSMSGQTGTVYRHLATSVTIADMREFRRHVIGLGDNGGWDLADWRANKTVIRELIEGGGALPPGVNFVQTNVVTVRKPS